MLSHVFSWRTRELIRCEARECESVEQDLLLYGGLVDAACLQFLWFAEFRSFVIWIISVDNLGETTSTARYSEHRPNTEESAAAEHIVLKLEHTHFTNISLSKEDMLLVERSIETGGQVHVVNTAWNGICVADVWTRLVQSWWMVDYSRQFLPAQKWTHGAGMDYNRSKVSETWKGCQPCAGSGTGIQLRASVGSSSTTGVQSSRSVPCVPPAVEMVDEVDINTNISRRRAQEMASKRRKKAKWAVRILNGGVGDGGEDAGDHTDGDQHEQDGEIRVAVGNGGNEGAYEEGGGPLDRYLDDVWQNIGNYQGGVSGPALGSTAVVAASDATVQNLSAQQRKKRSRSFIRPLEATGQQHSVHSSGISGRARADSPVRATGSLLTAHSQEDDMEDFTPIYVSGLSDRELRNFRARWVAVLTGR